MTDPNCPPDPSLERLVAERTAELEAIIDATANGLMQFDAQGRIVRMNPVAERLLGYTKENHEPDLARRITKLNFRWGDGRVITDPSDLPMPRALRGETVRNALVCFEHPETRRESWASVSASPIRKADGPVTGVVVTFTDVTEIRQAQERAEETRERLTNVLDSLLEGFIALGRDWRVLEINQTAAGLFRRNPADLLGKNMWEEFPAARRTHFYDNYERAFRENRPTHFEGLSAITNRWHEVHGYPRGDRIEIYFHDITDRKLLQAETHRQREFYNALLQAAPAGICVLDGAELRVKYANTAYMQFLDDPFRSERLIGRTLEEFVPFAREQGLVDLFHHVAETGEPYTNPEYRHEGFRRGATFWRYSLLPFYYGEASPADALTQERDLMIVAIEVTEQVENRRQLESLLQRSEEQAVELKAQADELTSISYALEVERTRLAAVIENMPVAVMLAEAPSGRLVLSNRRVEEIWRHPFIAAPRVESYREYLGFHPDGRPYEPEDWPLARALKGETIYGQEIDILRGDGTRGAMSASAAPIKDRDGRVIAAVVSFADVSERREVERALVRTRDELTSLLEISQTLVSTLDLPQVLALLVQELRAMIESDGVTIYMIDGDDLTVQEYVGPAAREEALAVRIPMRKTAGLWQAVRDRAPVYIRDLDEDTPLARAWHAPQAAQQRILAGAARSYLAVPMLVKGEPVGILRLTHRAPGHFTAEHARIATAIANQAAIAVENARLYGQAQEVAVLEERQRLARDLHDSVSQALFGVALATHNALTNWEKKPDVARERVRNANRLAKTAQAEMRALIFELRPDQLATDGLVKALELQTTALLERGAFEVEISLGKEPDVPLSVKEAFYRIAQEAINNAVKHARPSRLSVRLANGSNLLSLEVRDDGRGFDPAALYPGHFGLRSMHERAQRVGADLSITSHLAGGSRVLLTYGTAEAR
jgi:signal transduction histidine kinase/PAS domain-containing protein